MIAGNDSMRRRFDGESFSQESPQDVYDFNLSSQGDLNFSSQGSTQSRWSLNNLSSQESAELTILPAGIGAGKKRSNFEGFGGRFWKSSKKLKTVEPIPIPVPDPDSDEVIIISSKKAPEKPYSLDSSQESEEVTILGVKKVKENGVRKTKKVVKEKNKRKQKVKEVVVEVGEEEVSIGPTATLMETQEFGEMMEHVDEVDFALDGLRKGQPVSVRRGSLLSLLSICGTAAQRRKLRAHGMDKTIIDAIMGLGFDDSSSNLAAAALFYILTIDAFDDYHLDLPSCIHLLMKLLRPPSTDALKMKEPTFGSKLLSIRMDPDNSQSTGKGSEITSAILLKVHEVLVSCKDLEPRDENDRCTEIPELNPKWISMLTMEKACFSKLSIEDTSGRVRRTGAKFKEKLRELGGLDAVFEVVRSCHSVIEGLLERGPVLDYNEKAGLESMALLLKCLKIMENATFLSNGNQSHLLGMKGKFDSQKAPRSFIKLILSVIKILSGISLLLSSLGNSVDEKTHNNLIEARHLSNCKVNVNEIASTSSTRYCTLECNTSLESIDTSQDSQGLISDHPPSSKSSLVVPRMSRVQRLLRVRNDTSTDGPKSGDCTEETAMPKGFKLNLGGGNSRVLEDTNPEPMDDSQDPFAFDEENFEPSKWDVLAGSNESQACNTTAKVGATENDSECFHSMNQKESQMEDLNSSVVSCSSAKINTMSNLLADCLLSAVKVLMNLTNDNPMGCQQIAACGGLEILSSLIASHYPSFSSYMPPSGSPKESVVSSTSSAKVENQKDKNLTDQELDLLVAILGLLVNLVEKDSLNRTRLAAVRVSLHNLEGLEEERTALVPLLCSIFLANQGVGEATSEGKCLSWDDEDALIQGEKEAEKMILEAYAALLLAFLSTEGGRTRRAIAECLPDHKIAVLVPVLERFVEFHFSLDMITPETHAAVLGVIESCRIP